MLERRGPGALLKPGFVLTAYGPRWHSDRHHPQWIVAILGAELEGGAQGDRQADSWLQFHTRWLLAVVPSPHLAGTADDVPDLLHGGVGDCSRYFARFKLEVSETAESSYLA